MRVFVAGGTGVVGRRLVPRLVIRGHQVTATTSTASKVGLIEQMGADPVVLDGLDAMTVGEAVARARPAVIVHQMSAIGGRRPDMKHMDGGSPRPIGCAPRERIICWPPLRPSETWT